MDKSTDKDNAEAWTSEDLPAFASFLIAMSSFGFGVAIAFGLYFELIHLFKIGALVEGLAIGFYLYAYPGGGLEKYVLSHSNTIVAPFAFVVSFLFLAPVYVRRSIRYLTHYMSTFQVAGFPRSSGSLIFQSIMFFIKSCMIYLIAYPCAVMLVHVILNLVYLVLIHIVVLSVGILFDPPLIGELIKQGQIVIDQESYELISFTWTSIMMASLPVAYLIYKGIQTGSWSLGFTLVENILANEVLRKAGEEADAQSATV